MLEHPRPGTAPLDLLDPSTTAQAIQIRWGVSAEVACKAIVMARLFHSFTGRDLNIISGYRDPRKQEALRERGRPAADPAVSNHTVCPARALDFWVPGASLSNPIKIEFGRAAQGAGFRWGGGSPLDSNGIPSDWNHVDLGPRPR